MLLPLSPAILLSLASASCYLLGVQATPIANGDSILAELSPWYVQINKRSTGGNLHCSGSVVTNYHVLTAAHCHTAPEDVFILVGSVNTDGSDADDIIDAVRFVAHPRYVIHPNYDVSMMTLSRDITFSGKVRPISWNLNPNVPQIGEQLQVVGNGAINVNNQSPVDRQGIVAYPTPADRCLHSFGGLPPPEEFDRNVICLEYPGMLTACPGDSGTGVVMNGNLLVAVFSSGPQKCAVDISLGMVVRTSSVGDFITSEINEKGPIEEYI